MSELIEVTTYSGTLRHLASATAMHGWNAGLIGRGVAICNQTRDGRLYDQAALDGARRAAGPDEDLIDVSSLPTCKRCFQYGGRRMPEDAETQWTTAWRKPVQPTADALNLLEVAVLRRVRDGESHTNIGRALGLSSGRVSSLAWRVRQRFQATSTAELLAMPRVIEQLREDGVA